MTKEQFFKNRPSFRALDGHRDLIGIEIGVYGGENALNILTHLSVSKLYLIDPYLHYGGMKGHGAIEDEGVANKLKLQASSLLNDFTEQITWIYDFSEYANSQIVGDVDFVYIDGNHRYEFVKKDIELYYPLVKSGGILAGHDHKAGEPGVRRAVQEFCKQTGNTFMHDNWDWWIIK